MMCKSQIQAVTIQAQASPSLGVNQLQFERCKMIEKTANLQDSGSESGIDSSSDLDLSSSPSVSPSATPCSTPREDEKEMVVEVDDMSTPVFTYMNELKFFAQCNKTCPMVIMGRRTETSPRLLQEELSKLYPNLDLDPQSLDKDFEAFGNPCNGPTVVPRPVVAEDEWKCSVCHGENKINSTVCGTDWCQQPISFRIPATNEYVDNRSSFWRFHFFVLSPDQTKVVFTGAFGQEWIDGLEPEQQDIRVLENIKTITFANIEASTNKNTGVKMIGTDCFGHLIRFTEEQFKNLSQWECTITDANDLVEKKVKRNDQCHDHKRGLQECGKDCFAKYQEYFAGKAFKCYTRAFLKHGSYKMIVQDKNLGQRGGLPNEKPVTDLDFIKSNDVAGKYWRATKM